MLSFFSKQKTAFGLDLSESSLRAMMLERSGKGFFPVSFCDLPMPKGYFAEDKVSNPEKLGGYIKQALARPTVGRLDSRYAVISVPESKSFVRVIYVPKMTLQEAREAVPFEAEQYIPMAADSVYLDFKIVAEPAGASPADKMKVLICAAPRDLVDGYVAAVKHARLQPVAVEVESEAVARSLIDPKLAADPTMILDISSTRTNIVIFDQGTLQFTSSLPVGGNSFTSQIASSLTVAPDEAEKIKRQSGLLVGRDGNRIVAALQPVLSGILEAVKNTVNFYREHSDGSRKIGRILLCGGGSKIKGLAEYMNRQLPGPVAKGENFVRTADPWINVLERPIKKIPPISKSDSTSYATVIGLALRGADFE